MRGSKMASPHARATQLRSADFSPQQVANTRPVMLGLRGASTVVLGVESAGVE